jgi:hypothetical protein
MRVKEFNKSDEGKYVEDLAVKEYQIAGKFDVKVTTGSGLPFSKQDKVSKAFELFDRQVIDDEELMKALDFPNWETVLARVQEKKAAQAQAQAQAAPPK